MRVFNFLPELNFKVSAHYIDGSTKTLLFDSKYDPKINAARGTYWIEYGAYTELGVVRFEIISKKKR